MNWFLLKDTINNFHVRGEHKLNIQPILLHNWECFMQHTHRMLKRKLFLEKGRWEKVVLCSRRFYLTILSRYPGCTTSVWRSKSSRAVYDEICKIMIRKPERKCYIIVSVDSWIDEDTLVEFGMAGTVIYLNSVTKFMVLKALVNFTQLSFTPLPPSPALPSYLPTPGQLTCPSIISLISY